MLGETGRALEIEREAVALDTFEGIVGSFRMWRIAAESGLDVGRELQITPTARAAAVLDLAVRAYDDRDRIFSGSVTVAPLVVVNVALVAAVLGDVDTSPRAWGRVLPDGPGYMLYAWMPWMHEVREHPDFALLMSEIGLSAYWRQTEWPALCGPAEAEGIECR